MFQRRVSRSVRGIFIGSHNVRQNLWRIFRTDHRSFTCWKCTFGSNFGSHLSLHRISTRSSRPKGWLGGSNRCWVSFTLHSTHRRSGAAERSACVPQTTLDLHERRSPAPILKSPRVGALLRRLPRCAGQRSAASMLPRRLLWTVRGPPDLPLHALPHVPGRGHRRAAHLFTVRTRPFLRRLRLQCAPLPALSTSDENDTVPWAWIACTSRRSFAPAAAAAGAATR